MIIYPKINLKIIISILLFIPFWFLLYAFLHEAGHAIIGLIYGGTIENFVFWNFNAHVSIVNADYSTFGLPLMNIAGLLLPFIVVVIAVSIYNKNNSSVIYKICYLLSTLSIFGTMTIWVIYPIRFFYSSMSFGEDVVNFLYNTNAHPLLFAVGMLSLLISYIMFCYWRGVYNFILAIIKSKKNPDNENEKNAVDVSSVKNEQKPKSGFISLLLFILALVIILIAFFMPFEHPSILKVDEIIEDVRFDNIRTHEFIIEETGQHFFDIDISSEGVIIGIIIQDIYDYIIYSGTGYFTSQRIGLGLLEGNYFITFKFFTEMESLRDFLVYVEVYDVTDLDTLTLYNDIFRNSSGNYSVEYTLRVR